jgi:hypothetical protein
MDDLGHIRRRRTCHAAGDNHYESRQLLLFSRAGVGLGDKEIGCQEASRQSAWIVPNHGLVVGVLVFHLTWNQVMIEQERGTQRDKSRSC